MSAIVPNQQHRAGNFNDLDCSLDNLNRAPQETVHRPAAPMPNPHRNATAHSDLHARTVADF